jgi:hypothetical protein
VTQMFMQCAICQEPGLFTQHFKNNFSHKSGLSTPSLKNSITQITSVTEVSHSSLSSSHHKIFCGFLNSSDNPEMLRVWSSGT